MRQAGRKAAEERIANMSSFLSTLRRRWKVVDGRIFEAVK